MRYVLGFIMSRVHRKLGQSIVARLVDAGGDVSRRLVAFHQGRILATAEIAPCRLSRLGAYGVHIAFGMPTSDARCVAPL